MKSRENRQLAGNYLTVEELGECDPIKKVADLWLEQRKNINGKTLPDGDPAVPCGLVAKSFFNDTYRLYKRQDGDDE